MINHIIYRVCKYEDGHTSLMAWTADNEDGFNSEKEALTSLATWLWEKYKIDTHHSKTPSKVCCKQSSKNDYLANYCRHCGSSLQTSSYSADEFEIWLSRLSGTTCDSFGEWDGVTVIDGADWNPWIFPPNSNSYWKWPSKEEVVTIPEDGELVLAKLMVALAECDGATND
jgi:hypothetical protein